MEAAHGDKRDALLQAELRRVQDELALMQRRLQEQVRLARINALQRDVLLNIAQMAASGRPLVETLQALVYYAAELVHAEGAAFGRMLPSGLEMEFIAAWGQYAPFQGERLGLERTWTLEVLQTGTYALYDSRDPDPRARQEYLERFHIRSLVVVPLRVKGQVAGVLWVSSHNARSPSLGSEEAAFLDAFANQAGLVLSEALAYNELERRVRQLLTLKDLGLALFQLDGREQLLELTQERVVNALGVPMCYIAEADWENGVYHEARLGGLDDALPDRLEITGDTITGRTLLTGRPQAHHHRPSIPGCDRPGVNGSYSSFLSVPLPGDRRPVGAMTVAAIDSHHFDDDDLHFLETVASYLSVALTRVKRLDQLSHELEQLDAIIEQVSNPVLVADTNRIIVRANQAVRALTGLANPIGLSVTEAIRRLNIRLPGGESHNWKRVFSAVMKGERVEGVLMQVTLRSGEDRWLSLTATPVRDSAGVIRYFVGIGQDVTEQRQVERAKDEFLSMVSHELKTPLTAIKGFAQLLEKQAEKAHVPGSMQRALGMIDQEASRMTCLVNELLDVSRIQLGKMRLSRERVDAVPLLRRVVERSQASSPRHHLHFHAPDEGLEGFWDAGRLEQVLRHLLENAVKYQPEGGPITVEVARMNGHLRVAVTDQGAGIEPEALPHVFERFYRVPGNLSDQVSGMGLGLWMAAEVIRGHGGQLQVSSEPGRGSCFWFDLPLEEPQPDAPDQPAPHTVRGPAPHTSGQSYQK